MLSVVYGSHGGMEPWHSRGWNQTVVKCHHTTDWALGRLLINLCCLLWRTAYEKVGLQRVLCERRELGCGFSLNLSFCIRYCKGQYLWIIFSPGNPSSCLILLRLGKVEVGKLCYKYPLNPLHVILFPSLSCLGWVLDGCLKQLLYYEVCNACIILLYRKIHKWAWCICSHCDFYTYWVLFTEIKNVFYKNMSTNNMLWQNVVTLEL